MSDTPFAPRSRAVLKWTAVALGALVLLLVLALALVDWNALKGPIERLATERSGRTVSIRGPLDVHIWSWTPRLELEGLTIGGPPWDSAKPLVQLDRLRVELQLLALLKGEVILPRIELVRPQIYLHRERSGRANWTFENTRPSEAPAEEPPKLPVVRNFLVQRGELILRDEALHLDVRGTVQAREQSTRDDPEAFRIKGEGTLNKEPFALRVAGGPLVNLDPDHPYPFDMEIEAGDIRVKSDGIVRKPFDMGRISFNVHASGSDLADLYYLTHLAFPNTPPYRLSAHIDRNVKKLRVTQIAGTLGQSDVRGELSVDASRKRPTVTGDLTSNLLRLRDLAASLGGKPATGETIDTTTQAKTPKPNTSNGGEDDAAGENAKLFPTARLQVDRVRAMDADVRFKANSIEAGSVPMKQVAFHVRLNDGVLEVAPLEVELPQGKLEGTVKLDARTKTPQTRIDVRLANLQLDQLKGKAPDAEPPLGGVMQARAVLEGRGDSVHDVMADADGRFSAILPHGEVRAAFAELTGINLVQGLGLLLKDDRAEVRCGIAQFTVKDGTMRAENVVFDTENVRIVGRGEIQLGSEELDLSVKGEPKKPRIARLRTPVEINGHLRKPSVGIDTGKTLKQAAIATALGAALTPLAAVIAFVDPGLAKDANCAALLADAK